MTDNPFVFSEPQKESPFAIAIIHAVHADGLQLVFDGEANSSGKKYKVLKSCMARAGDRVLCAKASGTYVVLGVIATKASIVADGIQSVDDPLDYIKLTYNPTKKVYAVTSARNDPYWRDFYEV